MKLYELLETKGPAWKDLSDVASTIKVQLIGPQFSRRQLLQTCADGKFLNVDKQQLEDWFDFLREFGEPDLYGDRSTPDFKVGADSVVNVRDDEEDGGEEDGGEEDLPDGILPAFRDQIIVLGKERKKEAEKHLAAIDVSQSAYAQGHKDAADQIDDGEEASCFSTASSIVAVDARAVEADRLLKVGAEGLARQMNTERERTAKAAGEEGDQQRIAVTHSGDPANDFDLSKYHYAAHPTLFSNGRGLMKDRCRRTVYHQQEYNQYIFGNFRGQGWLGLGWG